MKQLITFTGLCVALNLTFLNYSNAASIYYRTIQSGFWKDPSSWETASDAAFTVNVLAAANSPDYTEATISIRNSHSIIIDQSITMDETIVEIGGSLIYGNYPASVISINDGIGIDLQINGSFEDSGPFNITWNTGSSSWALGTLATIIRTRSTSATLWRDHYEGSMALIPSGSNWIIRKQGTDNPSISTIASYYGNLKIENATASFWNANVVGSKFTGTTSNAIIKGNMEIGTMGDFGIKFYSQNSALNPVFIKGSLKINLHSEFNLEDASTTNGSTGLELQGDLIVEGIFSYDPPDANDNNRILKFSGTNNQKISGNGIIKCFNLLTNKISGDLILEREITVDNNLYLTNGKIELNKNTLTLQKNSSLALIRTNGWIRSETPDNNSKLIWNIGSIIGTYEFPFGKDATHYIPFYFSLTSGNVGMVSASTYSTGTDNIPFPISPILVTNLDVNGSNNSALTVDRFWEIDKTGSSGIANISFNYNNSERPMNLSTLEARRYNSLTNIWEQPLCCQIDDAAFNKVTIPNVQNFSTWTIMEKNDVLTIPKNFNAPITNNLSDKPFLSIFPNPFQDHIIIEYLGEEDMQLQCELLNCLGVVFLHKEMEILKGNNYFKLDLESIPQEQMFYLKIIGKEKITMFKILKE